MSSSENRLTSATMSGDLQIVPVPTAGKPPLARSSNTPSSNALVSSNASSSNALVEYTAPTTGVIEDEDLEIKLRRILECVPVRVSNTSGSSAGSGSGDFHQYRQMRRKEQDRIARMEVDYQKRKEIAEFNKKREERLKEAEERTAKKRARRQKKKQRKKGKANELGTASGGDEHPAGGSSSEDEAGSGRD